MALIVDAMNVIGSRPDGWWRDRPAAVRALVDRLGALGEEVTVVVDGREPVEPPGSAAGVSVVYAGSADDEIVRIVGESRAPGSLRIVTSDVELAGRVRELGADVVGAGAFRRRLDGS